MTVFVTAPRDATPENPQRTAVLLPRVAVLSVGESALPRQSPIVVQPSGAAGHLATAVPSAAASIDDNLARYVVTLAVTPEQAEQLIGGYNRGILHLGLLGARATVTASPTVADRGAAG